MQHELIKKLEDGSSVKVLAKLIADTRGFDYMLDVFTKAKGKRSWTNVVNTDEWGYRNIPFNERSAYSLEIQKKAVGAELLDSAMLELWSKVKPPTASEDFSFVSVGRDVKLDGEPIVGVWTDGIMLSSDNLSSCAYRLKAGNKYKVSVVDLGKSEGN
jgi:hypothetical protein